MRSGANCIDTDLLRQRHPIVDVIARYGIELRPSGSAFTGRCPFHVDRGRPNLAAYPRSGRYVCFRCDAHGDAIEFVRQLENVSFREAVARLDSRVVGAVDASRKLIRSPKPHRSVPQRDDPSAPSVLAAALELYQNRLLSEAPAMTYLTARGFSREVVDRWHIGFAAGGELAEYLIWRRLSVGCARRLGLLDKHCRERLSGRIIIPEIRRGQPIWFIGRLLDDSDDADKYWGLPGTKPLLGWDEACGDRRAVAVVEGPLDLLALRMWGVPGVATCGTRLSPAMLNALDHWQRLYVLMDADQAGQGATTRLVEAFGSRALPVDLPPGTKDVAELAPRPEGDVVLASAIHAAWTRTCTSSAPRSDGLGSTTGSGAPGALPAA
jgi:DNA primase